MGLIASRVGDTPVTSHRLSQLAAAHGSFTQRAYWRYSKDRKSCKEIVKFIQLSHRP